MTFDELLTLVDDRSAALRSAAVASPEATLVISESSSFELASTPS